MQLARTISIVLLTAASPWAASQEAPLSGPSILPGDTAVGPAAGRQEDAALATDGSGTSLVAWTDHRASFSRLVPSQAETEVYAARVDATGTLLDPQPIHVSAQGFGTQEEPQVAWNGENWLVTWLDQVPTQFFYTSELRAARIAPDGSLLDETPIVVHTWSSSGSFTSHTLSSDGTNWSAVLQDTDLGGIVGIRVAPDGTVLDPTPVLLQSTQFLASPLSFAFSSGEGRFLLVWHPFGGGVATRLFDRGLQPVGAQALVTSSSGARSPGAASDGTRFLVPWIDSGPGSQSFVRARRVSAAGQLLDPAPIEVSGDQGPFTPDDGDVVWDGTNFVVSWEQGSSFLELARVSSAGAVLDFGGVPFAPTPGTDPDEHELAPVAGGGARVVWTDDREGGPDPGDVYAADVTATLAAGTELAVSVGVPRQIQPDLAAGDDRFLVAFVSETSAGRRVVFQRVLPGGQALDPEPVELASGNLLADPHVGWDGTRWLVAWTDTLAQEIRAARVAPDGSVLDPTPFFVMPGISPDVAGNAGVFLVTGTDEPTSELRYPFSLRIDGATGTPLDPAPAQLGAQFSQFPSVAAIGSGWIVAWQRNFSHDDPKANVTFTVVGASGVPTMGARTLTGAISYDPAVAVGPDGQALVLWRDDLDGSTREDVFAQRVDAQGTILDLAPITVSAAPEEQSSPAAAFDGTRYVLAWEDQSSAVVFFDERSELTGSHLTTSGSPEPTFALAGGLRPAVDPSVDVLAGDPLFAGATFLEAPFHAWRVSLEGEASSDPYRALERDGTSTVRR